jgi:transcriptional regulator of acetoin/glycerol metabolism
MERERIMHALRKTGGNCSRASKILGISRMTLYNKIKAYDLDLKSIKNI